MTRSWPTCSKSVFPYPPSPDVCLQLAPEVINGQGISFSVEELCLHSYKVVFWRNYDFFHSGWYLCNSILYFFVAIHSTFKCSSSATNLYGYLNPKQDHKFKAEALALFEYFSYH